MPALLQAVDVGVRHPSRERCTPAGVSLAVHPGDVLLLLGPSGSGKSTLTLTFNGLIPQSVPAQMDGRVLVGASDTAVTPVGELSTSVGMVFQNPDAQIVTATVFDEACFGPENLGLPVDEVLERAHTALRLVGLADRCHDDPAILSGGQRQRLALAAALSLRPTMLVLDEPTANIDPAGTRQVFELLHRLVDDGVIDAVVLVEHHLDDALPLVNRVVVLDPDGPALDGSVTEIFREHTGHLERLGVWLPTALRAGRRLASAGVSLDPMPVLPAELASALADVDHLPPLTSAEAARPAPACPAPVPRPHGDSAPARTFPDEAAVDVANLGLHRGGTPVLDAVSLRVCAGEFWAVIGTNGAGKTTLLQAIAGLVKPSAGSVTATESLAGGGIGYVFQNPEHQFICATVFDEVAHGLRVRGAGEDHIRATVEPLLKRFDLDTHPDQNPFTLSGGQKRRLSVATALVTTPSLLLLDEPTFGQDQARAEELLALIDSLNATGTTVLMVTHDLQQVSERASHILVLDAGRKAAAGPAATIMADGELLHRHGLELSPLNRLLRPLAPGLPDWAALTRLRDLPGAARP